ncbi:hypothetical protein ANCCAN_24016 [Ancylostoma caninum]|uniref:Uncharacterized protein n=1 Tax=Ancylostoma caninum TaxID=29170 RepID=A0A368FH55_ANCCA|nr:hypothetical protein ANCCAN_24016 [Ancylostoma caninum]
MNTSTLVETVNINLEDFSETFLTCSTCLYTYDQLSFIIGLFIIYSKCLFSNRTFSDYLCSRDLFVENPS